MPWFARLGGLSRRLRKTRTALPTRLTLEMLETRTLLSAEPSLTLVLASHSIAENAGPAATTGTVTRNNMSDTQALTVNLTSSNPSQVTVPATVTIAAGDASATFNVDAVDNSIVDPTQTVTITATAPPPAEPDPSFGNGGLASVPLQVSSSANFPDIKVQSDGKIVAVAASPTSGATWAVSRTNADGTPDTTFGNGGTVTTTFANSTGGYANGIAFQPDGKIIVVGTVNLTTSNYSAWGVARYNSDGSLDTTFNGTGMLILPFSGEAGWAYDAAVLSNGDILVGGMRQDPAGFAVARLTSSGQLDTTFGVNGYAGINPDPTHSWYNTTGQAMIVQSDGKILMTGIANFNSLPVVRFNADGTPDTTFGNGGVELIPASAFGSYASIQGDALALQSDGKILAVGYANKAGSNYSDFVVARLNPDGSTDTGFSGDGLAALNFAGGDNQARDVAVQADGKILVGGRILIPNTAYVLGLARYNPDGTLDTTFNGTGELTTTPPAAFESIWGMDLQTDGKLDTIVGYNTSMQVIRYETGQMSASDSLSVTDVPPTAAVSGPTASVQGQAQLFTFTAQDDSPADQAAGFTYTIDWGDQSTSSTSGAGSVALSHVFTAAGTYTVQVWATDKGGQQSQQPGTLSVTVTAAALQGNDLVIGGTTGNDTINLRPADTSGDISVSLNGISLGSYRPTGRILVYAQAGDDNVQLQSAKFGKTTVPIKVPAFLFGGDGNDTLNTSGSSANNVLVGGAGRDTLTGGGGRNILIGGSGADTLHGGNGDGILIAGVTDHDTNLAALASLLAEWGRTDLSYQQRINHLDGATAGGLNGSTYLNAQTVHDDAAVDQLFGQGGSDWFFAALSGSSPDSVNDRKHGEVVTAIT